MHLSRRAALLLAAIASAVALAAAGCGSDNNDNSSSGSGATTAGASDTAAAKTPGSGDLKKVTGLGEETGARHDEAVKQGQAAAKAAGGKAQLPPGKKIGFLQIVGGIESADRVANATKAALQSVGYSMVLCDGQGDPAKWVTCGNSLIDQGVQGIVTTGVDPQSVAGPLKKAKEKGIPWISVAGETAPGYNGTYGPDDRETGRVLSDYLIKRINDQAGGKADIAVHDFPIPSIHVRTEELKKKLQGTDIKIAAETTSDAANLIEGTRKTVNDQITKDPNLKAFWFAFDTAGQAGGQAVAARFPGKEFPDRPLTLTFHADPASQALLRSGQLDAVADVAYDVGSWVGVDQMLEYFARKKNFDQSPRPEYPGVGNLYTIKMIDKNNLPPENQYVAQDTDVVSFFKSKWASEFGSQS
jgi:ribose transport system substrate-binding protein